MVGAHRLLLATASAPIARPLSRLRLELFEAKTDAKIKAAIARDSAELDSAIDEILLASELDVAAAPPAAEDADLSAVLANECAL